jgi:hypothetical protein
MKEPVVNEALRQIQDIVAEETGTALTNQARVTPEQRAALQLFVQLLIQGTESQ